MVSVKTVECQASVVSTRSRSSDPAIARFSPAARLSRLSFLYLPFSFALSFGHRKSCTRIIRVSSRNNRTNDFVRARSAEGPRCETWFSDRATVCRSTRFRSSASLWSVDSWNLKRGFYGDFVLILIRKELAEYMGLLKNWCRDDGRDFWWYLWLLLGRDCVGNLLILFERG